MKNFNNPQTFLQIDPPILWMGTSLSQMMLIFQSFFHKWLIFILASPETKEGGWTENSIIHLDSF